MVRGILWSLSLSLTFSLLPLNIASEIFNSLESYSSLLNDTTVINEIFCLLPHQDLALAADAYNRRYGVNLKDTLQSKLSKTKNHLLLTIKLLQNGRSEDQTVDEALAAEQARTLNGILAKVTILGNLTDEASSELIDFILTLSYSQAQAVKVSTAPGDLVSPRLASPPLDRLV
jgi:hypothetical protein